MWRNLGRYKSVCTEMSANYEQELESLKGTNGSPSRSASGGLGTPLGHTLSRLT